jgi:hypothetical protein
MKGKSNGRSRSQSVFSVGFELHNYTISAKCDMIINAEIHEYGRKCLRFVLRCLPED